MIQSATTTRTGCRRRSWAVLTTAAVGVLAATLLFGSVVTAAGGAALHPAGQAAPGAPPAPRAYTITPASEPGRITGPSELKVLHPITLETTTTAGAADFRPHHFYPVPGRNIAVVAHFGPTSNIELFDMLRNTFVGGIPTGNGPRQVSYDPSYRFAYTANSDGSSISALDPDARRLVATVPVGQKPNYAQYAEIASGSRLFVENLGENTVSVIGYLWFEGGRERFHQEYR